MLWLGTVKEDLTDVPTPCCPYTKCFVRAHRKPDQTKAYFERLIRGLILSAEASEINQVSLTVATLFGERILSPVVPHPLVHS